MLGKLGIFFLRRNFGVWEKFRDLEGTILVWGWEVLVSEQKILVLRERA